MKKIILVTGSHRSGSSWLGKVLCESEKLTYVHEPFNINRYNNSPFNYWFEYVSNKTSIEQQEKVKSYLLYFYSIFHPLNLIEIIKSESYGVLRKRLSKIKIKFTKRTVLKDPIAIMSAEWIYENINSDVIVIIRHPAAFVASLKVKNWEFDFNDFLNQTLLIEDRLEVYSKLIIEYSKDKKDIVTQGILLWNIIHHTIHRYQEKFEGQWYFIKHEDLSRQPLVEFKKIFRFLDLDLDKKVEEFITSSTTGKGDIGLTRNSVQNIQTWKQRLSEEEIKLIKETTYDLWTKYYSDTDW